MDIEKLLAQMSLEQKAAQLTQFGAQMLNDPEHPDITGLVGRLAVTQEELDTVGSTLNTSGPRARLALQEAHMAADPNHIPLVFMQDVIHGYRTIYPVPLGMAATFDPELVRQLAAMAAEEAASAGVDVAFSPMVDLSRDARWGRVMEGGGEDVHLNCVMADAQVRGYLDKGMQSCVKHFACYGAGEAGRDYNTVDMSESRLRERFLPPYKAALDAGARCIMPSFNTLNGVPSVANPLLMNRILREEWGFDGVVVSDYGAVGELLNHGVAADGDDCAAMAMGCGCDLEMMTVHYLRSLKKLLADGRVTMEQIDNGVRRMLKLKQELGLFEHPEGRTDAEKYEAVCLSPKHRELARKAAEQSAVLLKNDGLLPLTTDVRKVAIIGPYADDGMIMGFWAMNGRAEETVTIRQGVNKRLTDTEVRCCKGCPGDPVTDDLSMIPEAEELAAWADQVILVLGESGLHSGESQSRARLELSDAQLALFRAVNAKCHHTAVLLMCGRPLAIPELADEARAILCMWQPGTEGGNAAARLLYGDAAPCGHLPMSFPVTTGQEPISYDMDPTGRMPADPWHSEGFAYHSRYLDCPVMPLYPFGYGLTYTDFALTEPRLSSALMSMGGSLRASVTVTNTGCREGACVVQLYIHDVVGSTSRPVRQLKDFRKLTLAPGEKAEVTFTITEAMLRFMTAKGEFAAEKGMFEVFMALDAVSGEKLKFELV